MENWMEWQKRLQGGLLVIWPPDKIRAEINKLRQEYDPLSQSYCEAHITMTTPLVGELDSADWNRLMNICNRIKPFEIKYGPPRVFKLKPVVYLAVFPDSRIKELHRAFLATGLFQADPPPPYDFVPHMTISEFGAKTDKEADRIRNQLENISKSGSFISNSIAYIRPDEDFHFTVHRTLPFKDV